MSSSLAPINTVFAVVIFYGDHLVTSFILLGLYWLSKVNVYHVSSYIMLSIHQYDDAQLKSDFSLAVLLNARSRMR
jgi:hypothetical protein